MKNQEFPTNNNSKPPVPHKSESVIKRAAISNPSIYTKNKHRTLPKNLIQTRIRQFEATETTQVGFCCIMYITYAYVLDFAKKIDLCFLL